MIPSGFSVLSVLPGSHRAHKHLRCILAAEHFRTRIVCTYNSDGLKIHAGLQDALRRFLFGTGTKSPSRRT